MLQPDQQRMPQPGFNLQRKNATAARERGGNLTHAPSRCNRCSADQADDRVRPTQTLVQLLLPILTHPNTTVDISIHENLVTDIRQPTPNPGCKPCIRSRIANE